MAWKKDTRISVIRPIITKLTRNNNRAIITALVPESVPSSYEKNMAKMILPATILEPQKESYGE